jgi:hypothetical protein
VIEGASWEVVARGVLDSLAHREISPQLAEHWLDYLIRHAEGPADVAELNDLPQPMG